MMPNGKRTIPMINRIGRKMKPLSGNGKSTQEYRPVDIAPTGTQFDDTDLRVLSLYLCRL
jgi:hypothetical protein